MSTNLPKAAGDQELDLSMISRGVGNAFESLNRFFFNCIRFVVKNIIVIGILFVLGVLLGNYMDRVKIYTNEVIVTPNFQTSDYLYAKIDLINAKAREHDTVFLKSIGLSEPRKFIKISIKPINGIYNFIGNNELRYKTLELMAEDTDMEQILTDKTTSGNYIYHQISYTTVGKTTDVKTLRPLLRYLNRSNFYAKIQKQNVENLKIKIRQNDILIAQINGILNRLAESKSESGNTIYNGDSQLNDVINTKDQLVREQGNNQLAMLSFDKIIKESSFTLNTINDESTNGKLKLIMPFVFIGIFILIYFFISFYKRQMAINKQTNN